MNFLPRQIDRRLTPFERPGGMECRLDVSPIEAKFADSVFCYRSTPFAKSAKIPAFTPAPAPQVDSSGLPLSSAVAARCRSCNVVREFYHLALIRRPASSALSLVFLRRGIRRQCGYRSLLSSPSWQVRLIDDSWLPAEGEGSRQQTRPYQRGNDPGLQ